MRNERFGKYADMRTRRPETQSLKRAFAPTGLTQPTTILSICSFLVCALLPLSALQLPIIGVRGAVALLALLCATYALLAGGRPLRDTVVFSAGSALILLIAAVGGSAAGPASEESLSNFASLLYSALPLVAVASYTMHVPQAARAAIAGYLSGAAVLSASTWILPNQVIGRYYGLASHPVEVGGTLAVAVCGFVFLPSSSNWRRAWSIGMAVLCLSGILRAQALTGLIAVAIGIAVGTMITRNWTSVVFAGVLLVAGTTALSFTPEGMELLLKLANQISAFPTDVGSVDYNSANTLASRLATMQVGIERARVSPILGRGLSAQNTIVLGDLQPHNIFVLAWLSGGLALAIWFAMILFSTIRNVARACRMSEVSPAAICILVCGATAWVGALTGPQLFEQAWLLPALLACMPSITNMGQVSGRDSS